jgi:hypothetical protein
MFRIIDFLQLRNSSLVISLLSLIISILKLQFYLLHSHFLFLLYTYLLTCSLLFLRVVEIPLLFHLFRTAHLVQIDYLTLLESLLPLIRCLIHLFLLHSFTIFLDYEPIVIFPSIEVDLSSKNSSHDDQEEGDASHERPQG